MARADLVINLVETGMKGDLPRFKMTAEAIAADARLKQHHHLATRLSDILTTSEVLPSSVSASMDEQLQNTFYELKAIKKIDDLVLPDDVKDIFHEVIEEYSRREVLRSYNLVPRHKILLSGPPGNGKTSLAEAFANHLGLPFYVVKYEGIIDRYLGKTSQHLDMMFEHVKTRRCVLFLDEFDSIGKEREDTNDNGEMKRVVNSLLKQIDMLPPHVYVVAATNHQGMLDKAIWRRFQVQLDIPTPTQAMAKQWFENFSERFGRSLGYTPSTLAQKLSGFSFAELEEFALDVQRKYVLGLPDSETVIKKITEQRLRYWKKRYKPED
ncbi:ATP-binding protein [Vibrio fluvialis]|uniref:AAA family ATPase n=1 Tax=Vibrio fluvialis TaxID=676 RepID=UPI001EE9E74A|nr:ATP-binding protein [Vibrio fluvialis]MCG6346549.1 ATP-binding protein [Vibrio fluvialis]